MASRHGKRWDRLDDKHLVELYQSLRGTFQPSACDEIIAEEMGRTPASIQTRRAYLRWKGEDV